MSRRCCEALGTMVYRLEPNRARKNAPDHLKSGAGVSALDFSEVLAGGSGLAEQLEDLLWLLVGQREHIGRCLHQNLVAGHLCRFGCEICITDDRFSR